MTKQTPRQVSQIQAILLLCKDCPGKNPLQENPAKLRIMVYVKTGEDEEKLEAMHHSGEAYSPRRRTMEDEEYVQKLNF